jgi:hypothetical protein
LAIFPSIELPNNFFVFSIFINPCLSSNNNRFINRNYSTRCFFSIFISAPKKRFIRIRKASKLFLLHYFPSINNILINRNTQLLHLLSFALAPFFLGVKSCKKKFDIFCCTFNDFFFLEKLPKLQRRLKYF